MTSDQPPRLVETPVAHHMVAYDNLHSDFERLSGRDSTYKLIASGNKQVLADGPIKNLDIPPTWNRTAKYDDGVGDIVTFKPATGAASLTSLEHNRPISDKTAQEFKKILEDNAHITSPKMLTPGQVRSLSEVLGTNGMGDNQYTNSAKYPDANAPLFKLTNAQITNLNGRSVLEVEGSFMDQKGNPTEMYKGILSPSGKDGNKVNEFFLAAPNREELVQQDATYRRALKSIEWR